MFTQFKYLVPGSTASAIWQSSGKPKYPIQNIEEDTKILTRITTLLPEKRDNRDRINLTKTPNLIIKTNNQNFTGAEVSVGFINEFAGYQNVFGYYMYHLIEGFNDKPAVFVSETETDPIYAQITRQMIDTDDATTKQNILNRVIIFPRVKKITAGGPLATGDTVQLKAFAPFTFDGSAESYKFANNVGIGFFVIPNGWSNGIKTDSATMRSILYSDGYLNVNSTYPNGVQQSALLFDGNLSGIDKTSAVVTFEDIILPGGDRDYNDVLFRVTYTPSYAMDVSDLQALVPREATSTDYFIAKQNGMEFNLKSSTITYLKNLTCDKIIFEHVIETATQSAADNLYEVFSRNVFVSAEKLVRGDKKITIEYVYLPENIAEVVKIYRADDNQTAMYYRNDGSKNITHMQSDYIFGPNNNWGAITEYVNVYCKTGEVMNKHYTLTNNGTNRVRVEDFPSPLSQGDPHITTLTGINYLLPHIEKKLEMYNNGEFVINTTMAKYKPYENHHLAMMRESTFMSETEIKLGEDEYVIINNHTLEIISTNAYHNIVIGQLNKPFVVDGSRVDAKCDKPHGMNYRMVKISAPTSGDTYVRFVSVPNIYDQLNLMDVINNNLFTIGATGALVNNTDLKWY